MKKILSIFLILCCSVITVFVFADNEQTAVNEIQSLFNETSAAFNRKDSAGIIKIAAPDALINYLDGNIVSVDEWGKNITAQLQKIKNINSVFTINSIEAVGDFAVVDYSQSYDYSVVGQRKDDYYSVSRWKATLLRFPQGWRVKSFVELSEETTLNGTPLVDAQVQKFW